jgi:tetratricopeptide (TPR) repeat protein
VTNKVPVVRKTSWVLVAHQFIVLAVFVLGAWVLFGERMGISALALGAGGYLVWSFGSRALLTQSHRQGMLLTRQGRYKDAIKKYEASYAFFSKHRWVDDYRSLVLLTPSATSYREMALVNMAYCYAKLGKDKQAIAAYERTLEEFPESAIAKATLKLIYEAERGNSPPNGKS